MKTQNNAIHDPRTPPDGVPVHHYIAAPVYVRFSAHMIDRLILYLFTFTFFPAMAASPPARAFKPIGVWVIALLITTSAYLILARRSQTVGKFITRCKVVKYDGTPPNYIAFLARETFGKLVSSILIIGHLWYYFDSEGRTLHDIMMKTYVIDIRQSAQDFARRADQRRHAHHTSQQD